MLRDLVCLPGQVGKKRAKEVLVNARICRSWLPVIGLWSLFASFLAPSAAVAAQPGTSAQQKQRQKSRLDVPIHLTDGVRTVVRTRRELGFRVASRPGQPVAFSAEKGTLKQALRRIAPRFRQAAADARPFVYRGQTRIDPGSHSRALNVSTTAERLAAAVARKPATVRFRVSIDKQPPVLTVERLKGITGVIGTYSTRAALNAKRNKNIRLAVTTIDGALLSPGETFSLKQTIGRPTQASGYRTAPVFVNAETVPGIGGGLSQVTGTLFNAAALAGLKIVEVNPHSRPVSYIPVGRDATYSHGAKDLRFVNQTGAPVYISYSFQGGRLRATFFGRKNPGQKVVLRPQVQRLGPGKVNAQLYRIIRQNGRLTAKEKLFEHAYRWNPKTRGV
jgi:vancomycin resistance protein YoaR